MIPEKRAQKIRLLPENTINQIAAGEVIESSASVVKELIDNAIDAGAEEICIETLGGGRALIRVQDDGCGMGRDDLFMALERHATSKISESSDLVSLATLGFRGEALPSIASISKMTLISALEGEVEGTALHVHGGKMIKWESLPRKRGTTVEVRSLFYNVPVRKRFQKSLEADRAQIQKVFMQAAIAFPEIKFRFKSEAGEETYLPANEDLLVRIERLFGEEYARKFLPIEEKEEESYTHRDSRIGNAGAGKNPILELRCVHVSGFISTPSFHYPNRRGHYLFLNRRAVFSPFISHKIVEGYGTRLPIHRFPLFFLHLMVPPQWVDVNVHPQKKEVRLCEEKRVGKLLLHAVENALEKRHVPLVVSRSSLPEMAPLHFSDYFIPYKPEVSLPTQRALPLKEKVFQGLGQIGGYFVAKTIASEELLLVDIRAARARIIFEKVVQKEEAAPVQALLFPLTLEFDKERSDALTAHLEELNDVGIGIRPLGEKSFMVDSLPPFLEGEEIKEILDSLLTEASSAKTLERKNLLASLCRSIRARNLSIREGEALMEQLFSCENPHESPWGKKTYLIMKESEIAKRINDGS